jgi:hypothetical protein
MHGTPILRPTAREVVNHAHTSISAIMERESIGLRGASEWKQGASEGDRERGMVVGQGSGVGAVDESDASMNKLKGTRGEAGGGLCHCPCFVPAPTTGGKFPSPAHVPAPVPFLESSASHKPSNRPFAHIFS